MRGQPGSSGQDRKEGKGTNPLLPQEDRRLRGLRRNDGQVHRLRLRLSGTGLPVVPQQPARLRQRAHQNGTRRIRTSPANHKKRGRVRRGHVHAARLQRARRGALLCGVVLRHARDPT